MWKLRAPAYGLNDAPAAAHGPLRKYLVNSAELLPSVGLRFEVSSFDPFMYFVYRKSGPAVGVIATHIGDFSGCGEPDSLLKVRVFRKRDSEIESPGGVDCARGRGPGPLEGFL